ncbi:MAG: plastocyanin/azurin family copper-binding protein [Actinomycetota bacterium]
MNGDRRFAPQSITVKVGEPVTFTNESGEAHTVTAYEERIPDGARYFSSGGSSSESEARDDIAAALITEGETYEVTLDTPGTYEYFCIPHEQQGMKGTIVVKE